jgi:hypothetical protein
MTARTLLRTALMIGACTLGGGGQAGELIFRPLNPSFGGNPNLSAHFLNLAQIQNQHTASNGGGGSGGIPQITFPPILIDLGGTLPLEPTPEPEAQPEPESVVAPAMSVAN